MRMNTVENIMCSPVYTIDENQTVQQAVDMMDQKGTKKILVTSSGQPKGALERWKVCCDDYTSAIKQINPLGKIRVVPKGTPVDEVGRDLINFSAIYVSDPDKNNKLIGVVTSFDLIKTL